jgi:hypothetical protein
MLSPEKYNISIRYYLIDYFFDTIFREKAGCILGKRLEP